MTHLAIGFFDSLERGLESLVELRERDITPAILRQRSMLGSVSMLRVLAGVHAEVAVVGATANTPEIDAAGRQMFEDFLGALEPHLNFDRKPDGSAVLRSEWTEHPSTAAFFADPGAKAPSGRPQAMREFVSVLSSWARSGRVFPDAVEVAV